MTIILETKLCSSPSRSFYFFIPMSESRWQLGSHHLAAQPFPEMLLLLKPHKWTLKKKPKYSQIEFSKWFKRSEVNHAKSSAPLNAHECPGVTTGGVSFLRVEWSQRSSLVLWDPRESQSPIFRRRNKHRHSTTGWSRGCQKFYRGGERCLLLRKDIS